MQQWCGGASGAGVFVCRLWDRWLAAYALSSDCTEIYSYSYLYFRSFRYSNICSTACYLDLIIGKRLTNMDYTGCIQVYTGPKTPPSR